MDENQGYIIRRSVLFDNGRGFALGENPKAPNPFVTWRFTQEDGKRDYYWGHYHNDPDTAARDFQNRAQDYQQQYGVREVEQPRQEYKYYSTQRPVDIGTFPKDKDNPPVRIENYEGRIWVEHDTRLAWGELTYAQPLSEKELYSYELKPSRNNPDVRRLMDEQAQVVGKWEDAQHIPEAKRLTWFYPDFGSYVVKEFVSPERLAECARGVELQQAAADRRRAWQEKAPIAEQMREAGKLAGERQAPSAPKKEKPDWGGR